LELYNATRILVRLIKQFIFFNSFGFENLSYERIRTSDIKYIFKKTRNERRSILFTILGKLKLWYHPTLKKQEKKYNTKMTTIFEDGKEYLSGVILVFKKN
jgi:hypothetical protein